MAVDIVVPSVGESITEGTLSRWLKQDGEVVRADEPLFELETEKATTEVAAPAAGRLAIRAREGETVAIGAVVGQIDPVGAATRADRERPNPAPVAAVEKPAEDGNARLSPAARRLVEEKAVDVRQVAGSGRGGRITKEDVLSHLEQQPAEPAKLPVPEPAKPQVTDQRETRQRMSAIRQRIAERLVQAQKATASLTTFNEADLSAVLELRSRFKDRFKEKHGVGLGFMSFFVKACVEALRAFPQVNARIDGSDLVLCHYYDIGIAVSTEKGLMVPVLRDCDRLSFGQIEKGIAQLADKARAGKISVSDLQGGTFTITNGGVFGSLLSTPILNPPQSAILGMHTLQKRPVAVNDQVVIRPMMYLALTYDHRVIDGREAVQFLVRVKECVENPERLLLEV
jgi:2-oxoglutarate dehydrogenase E2 component (dihydrolipoamide succinyltransferase)